MALRLTREGVKFTDAVAFGPYRPLRFKCCIMLATKLSATKGLCSAVGLATEIRCCSAYIKARFVCGCCDLFFCFSIFVIVSTVGWHFSVKTELVFHEEAKL